MERIYSLTNKTYFCNIVIKLYDEGTFDAYDSCFHKRVRDNSSEFFCYRKTGIVYSFFLRKIFRFHLLIGISSQVASQLSFIMSTSTVII